MIWDGSGVFCCWLKYQRDTYTTLGAPAAMELCFAKLIASHAVDETYLS